MHIAGAINSTMGNMFDVLGKANAGKVLVVCYSGQSAAYAHMLLRLKGYEAYSLKFGMSIYDASLDKWTGNTSNQFANHANWVFDASAALPTYDYPELNTGEETGEAILDEQIQYAIDNWSNILIGGGDVINNPDAYAIYNYWGNTDYMHYGHIKDAYQLTPNTLSTDANLSALNPNETNVIYCWTGQTSAAMNAYLTVLGYTTKSLKFGVNSMIYDELTGHKWGKPWG
jgi:rhodanese-related sulfurtransferase